MSNFINFVLCILFFVLAALNFAIAAKDLSNKKFCFFGFELVTAIFMLAFSIIRFLSLLGG